MHVVAETDADKVIAFAERVLNAPLLPWQQEYVRAVFDPSRRTVQAPSGRSVGRRHVRRVIELYEGGSHGR